MDDSALKPILMGLIEFATSLRPTLGGVKTININMLVAGATGLEPATSGVTGH